MKNLSYLTALVVILALLVFGCSQEAPTVSSGNEVVPQIDMPAVSSEDVAIPQLTHGVEGNPTGNCCPEGFDIEFEGGDPADHNGDNFVCRKVTAGGTITIDNNAPGVCSVPCIPPCQAGE